MWENIYKALTALSFIQVDRKVFPALWVVVTLLFPSLIKSRFDFQNGPNQSVSHVYKRQAPANVFELLLLTTAVGCFSPSINAARLTILSARKKIVLDERHEWKYPFFSSFHDHINKYVTEKCKYVSMFNGCTSVDHQ